MKLLQYLSQHVEHNIEHDTHKQHDKHHKHSDNIQCTVKIRTKVTKLQRQM